MYLNKKKILIYIFLFLLYYLFSYKYGEFRESPYVIHAYLLLLSSIVFFVIKDLVKVGRKLKVKMDMLGVLLFLLFNFLSLVIALINMQVLNAMVMAGGQVALFYVFYSIVKTNKLSKDDYNILFCNFFILFGTVSFIFALYAYIFDGLSLSVFSISNYHSFRLTGWYGSPNFAASVFAVASLCSLFKLKSYGFFGVEKSFWSYLTLTAFMLNLLGLILTGSRGAWVAYIFAIFFFVVFQIRSFSIKPKSIYKFLFILILIVITIQQTFNYLDIDSEKIKTELIREDQLARQIDPDNFGAGRAYYWSTAVKIMVTSPIDKFLFGYGMDGIINNLGRSGHSGYLSVLVNRGFIAFSFLLFLIIYFFFKCSKTRNHHGTKLAFCIMIYLLIKNTTNNEFPSNGFTGIVFIMTLLSVFLKTINIEYKK